MSVEVQFRDILAPRKEPRIFHMMTKTFRLQKSYVLEKYYSPQDLKDLASKSVYLESYIEAECSRTGEKKEKLRKEVEQYLEEMGFDRKPHVIRWMGVFFLRVSTMMNIGIFVNEPPILKLKATMGKNPVLFLPTHRSYADFCLLTYLCYHYDIEFPAVAAGMDFYSMAIVGRRMRETGAFYIRRTLVGAPLYAATLRQYVRTTVAKYCAPVEFFLEGTRSRSNKSMAPKYGMLSMSLVPYFAREVSDVTIVPVTITYDRLMEQSLFAFEHLGVPKPKESTGGLIKALKSLNDEFGNIYINTGNPLSLIEYLKEPHGVSSETIKPMDLQQLTPDQFEKVQDVANYVVTLQQKNTIATISNLLSLVLMHSIVRNEALMFEDVLSEVEWTIGMLRKLGAQVYENDVKKSVERILVVHGKMMKLDKDKKLRLISGELINISEDVKKKMKGHILSAETMVSAVPIIQLQLYVNPILHYLVPLSVIYLIVSRGTASRGTLEADYHRIRKLFRYEFFHFEKEENEKFIEALQYCVENGVISDENGWYSPTGDSKVHSLLKWAVLPAFITMMQCIKTMNEEKNCEEKQAKKFVQAAIEGSGVHPYCLSLEAIANCLQGLALIGALRRGKRKKDITYEVVPDVIAETSQLISSVMPQYNVDFGSSNSVILDCRTVLSRL